MLHSPGELWIGSNSGVSRYQVEDNQFTRFRPEVIDSNVADILEDRQGQLWLATGSGLYLYNRSTDELRLFPGDPDDPNTINNDFLSHMYESETGILWFATFAGVDYTDPMAKPFIHYRHSSLSTGLNSNEVSAVVEGDNDTLWFGTFSGGLNRWDRTRGEFSYYTHNSDDKDSLNSNKIYTVARGKGGVLWLGTPEGLSRFDPSTESFSSYRYDPQQLESISKGHVMDISIAEDGTLWLAVFGFGLNSFNPETKKFQHFPGVVEQGDGPKKSPESSWPVRVLHDSHGLLWIGYEGGGLDKFNSATGIFEPHSKDQNLIKIIVNDLFLGENHVMWVATNDGLHRMDSKKQQVTVYRTAQGLASNSISSILEDDHGYLWFTTSKGLSRLHKKNSVVHNYDIY